MCAKEIPLMMVDALGAKAGSFESEQEQIQKELDTLALERQRVLLRHAEVKALKMIWISS